MNQGDLHFADQIIKSYQNGKLPHGPFLPVSMPAKGDIFILENKNQTNIYSWWGDSIWIKGPNLTIKRDK